MTYSNIKYKKGALFWVFDIIHEGHIFLISQSLNYVDEINIVLMEDWKVKEKKNRNTLFSQSIRKKILESKLLKFQNLNWKKINIIKGSTDAIKDLLNIQPDIVILGYDQNFEHKLESLGFKWIKLNPLNQNLNKSTIIRNNLKKRES